MSLARDPQCPRDPPGSIEAGGGQEVSGILAQVVLTVGDLGS